jgi:PEP-CTERM motif-containing protein
MATSVKLAISLAIALQVSATGAAADPVRIVAGSLSFDTGDPPAFSLLTSSGHLFEAEGFRKGWPATCFYQCAPGVAIPISLDNITQTDDGSMFFRADGVELFPVMQLVVSAPSVTLGSDAGTSNGPFVDFERPFTFSGRLTAYASRDLIGTPVFDLRLTGSGTASLSMALEDGRYSFSSLDYNFRADPVPEPATLLLLGTGAALIWRRRKNLPLSPNS